VLWAVARKYGGTAVRVSTLAASLLAPSVASAEWQLKPFLGVTFGGGTTLLDPEGAAGSANVAFGVTALLIGDMVGIEADLGYSPGFFQSGDRQQPLVVRSAATTLTGNVVVAVPRHLTQYTLRPYFVGGGGLMHARSEDFFGALPFSTTLAALDVGGGVTGFLTDRFGVNWDVRYLRSIRGTDARSGVSFGPEELSFWRANMALAIRF
jgi:Outer membrane protein beta-barrel domain